eukprot:TRINITY_DN3616_c0_g1_i1.p1 TRINITY_DN3616_c0_g1~~TRINITY_DN3616_c0_g1_i1.p1  ORF type:complete len:113 (+),score=26.03 TRINITY_DN3616_c0_g1_i1:131-469(+)
MGGNSSKGDAAAMNEWMKSKQDATAETTFIAEGGKRLDEKDLPDYMFGIDPRSAIQPCEKEKLQVHKCLSSKKGPECEILLDQYNKCEEKYFTKETIDELVRLEMVERNAKA